MNYFVNLNELKSKQQTFHLRKSLIENIFDHSNESPLVLTLSKKDLHNRNYPQTLLNEKEN